MNNETEKALWVDLGSDLQVVPTQREGVWALAHCLLEIVGDRVRVTNVQTGEVSDMTEFRQVIPGTPGKEYRIFVADGQLSAELVGEQLTSLSSEVPPQS